MKTIKLQILASDILETYYHTSRDCAITRALQRAGLNCKDSGVSIKTIDTREVINVDKTQYNNLAVKVMGMYSKKDKTPYVHNPREGAVKPLPIKDFTHDLTFLDLE